jgi:DUF2075 family protein
METLFFSEFSFDENLMGYAYMEDLLFSHSVFQKYPNSLLITPKAKCIHKLSKTARMANQEFKKHAQRYRKYVLTKLLGLKGLYIYYAKFRRDLSKFNKEDSGKR